MSTVTTVMVNHYETNVQEEANVTLRRIQMEDKKSKENMNTPMKTDVIEDELDDDGLDYEDGYYSSMDIEYTNEY